MARCFVLITFILASSCSSCVDVVEREQYPETVMELDSGGGTIDGEFVVDGGVADSGFRDLGQQDVGPCSPGECNEYCAPLSADECSSDGNCQLVQARRLEETDAGNCWGGERVAGCMGAQTCLNQIYYAEDSDGLCWTFGNDCIPENFEYSDKISDSCSRITAVYCE